MWITTVRWWRKVVAVLCIQLLAFSPAMGQVIENPKVVLELPVEVELELSPGTLKQAPLWHELAEMLEEPGEIDCEPGSGECLFEDRRQSFIYRNASGVPCAPGTAGCVNVDLPPLKVWSPCVNMLTGQPLRLRVSDGEINWDQPGPLFDNDEEVDTVGPDNPTPTELRTPIGALVVDAANNLRVSNPSGHPKLPADGELVATPACTADGVPLDEDGEVITEFETPISELDFLRPDTDTSGVPVARQQYIGRPAAQVLGKALFWDMQVGSDGVQACGSCHFHAGVDNRTKNQLNPNHLGGDHTLQVHAQPNQDLVASDFPFHKLHNPDLVGEPMMNPGNVARDANDVMSSMGVRFRKFQDIRPIGTSSFGPVSNGVRPLLPDLSVPLSQDPEAETDPIPVFQGLRRVEPRNTPTIFGTAFNFDNFWDGRARHDFNGGSVFGPVDPQLHVFIDPGAAGGPGGGLTGATNGLVRPEIAEEDPELGALPVRSRFSSLASLSTGPALSEFEMSFLGRNWAKIGKKLLQGYATTTTTSDDVIPLANQLVHPNDSVLGPFSGQRSTVGGAVDRPNRPGLNVSYAELIQLAFAREYWQNSYLTSSLYGARYFLGAPATCTASAVNGVLTPATCDPFDGYKLSMRTGVASATNTSHFRQIEANFSLFFGLSVQIWQEILLPDDTPFDRFMDANPLAAEGVAQPGEQATLFPSDVAGLVCPGQPLATCLKFPDPAKFGPEELFGFDIFAGGNVTAALPLGSARNPAGQGSNPFHRTARCMICHIGPEQTDHTNNVNAGLFQGGTEFEFPTPQTAPEPTGPFRVVTGIPLAEEVEENAQDGVEVENRNLGIQDDPSTPWHEAQIGVPTAIAFQDNGVYNIGVRPTGEDIMRGGPDAFGWPLSLAAMALKNLGGADYEPCDDPGDTNCAISSFNPALGPGGGLFEETGADQRINPGLQMEPMEPQLPEYLAPWANNLPAGELSPQIDELAFAPNTVTEVAFAEFSEILFGADLHCGQFDPAAFGEGPPNFGWGPLCPNSQTGVPVNFDPPLNGTWPFPNRVARNGAVKAPQLRNVELTGPYFHTGSVLTLRQVVDFYMRGGDFPVTNAEDRDPNLVDVGVQAFGFGTTIGLPPQFQDAIPDVITQYGVFPDTTHETTPEPSSANPESAKVALVKYLLSLTDERVKFERAPFDHPEIFVPLDGTAPDNGSLAGAVSAGRPGFLNNLANGMFKRIPAVGAGGNATPLPNFLNVSSTPVPGPDNDHFDR